MGCNSSKSVEVIEDSNKRIAPELRIASPSKPSTKPKYKLNYFDLTGRAELIRIICAFSNIDLDDNRIKMDKWPLIKNNMPLGQLPVLEIEEQPMLVQSLAIARYLAKEAGLYGKNSLDMAKVDSVVETGKDLFEEFAKKIVPQLRNPTDQKDSIIKEFVQFEIPKRIEQLQILMDMYGSDSYFVGDEITLADIYVHDLFTNLLRVNPNLLDNYQNLKKNRDQVELNRNLKVYLEERNKQENK